MDNAVYFDEVEDELLTLHADNMKRLREIKDAMNVHHGGGLAKAKSLLDRQRKLATCLKTFDWLTSE